MKKGRRWFRASADYMIGAYLGWSGTAVVARAAVVPAAERDQLALLVDPMHGDAVSGEPRVTPPRLSPSRMGSR